MAERRLTNDQIKAAYDLLQRDIDSFPKELTAKVMFNRQSLRPHVQEIDQAIGQIAMEYGVKEDEELVFIDEEDEDDEPRNEVEALLGVRMESPEEAMREVSDLMKEYRENVEIATATPDQLREIAENGEDQEDVLDDWAWMVKVDV